MADENLNRTLNELKKLRVVDLKEELSALELSTSGLKADLVNRLYEYQQSTSSNVADADADADADESESSVDSVGQKEYGQLESELQGSASDENDEAEEAEKIRIAEDEEEKKRAEEAEKLRVAEEQKSQAEEAEKLRIEEAENIRIAEEQRKQAEEAEKLRIAEEQRKKAEEAEKLRIAEQQRKKAEEAEKLRIAEEEKRTEKLRIVEEQRKKAEEAEKLMIVEEQRKKAEEAEKLRIAEEQRKKVEAEKLRISEEHKTKAEEAEKLRISEEQRRKSEVVEKMRIAEMKGKQAEEAEKLRIAEEQRKKAGEAEKLRIAEEAAENKRQDEAEKARLAEEKRRQAEVKENLRIAEEKKQAEQRRQAEETERRRQAEKKRIAEEQRKQAAETERKRIAEEQKRLAAEAERKRIADEQRRRAAEAERKRIAEEQRRRSEESERARLAEERKKHAEAEEQRKQAEIKRKQAEEQRNQSNESKRTNLSDEKTRKLPGQVSAPIAPMNLPRIEAAAGPSKISGQPPPLMSLEIPKPLMSLDIPNPTAAAGDKESNQPIELPQALEKVLAFKSERALQIGVNPDDVDNVGGEGDEADADDEQDSFNLILQGKSNVQENNQVKESKNKRRKKKKKRRDRSNKIEVIIKDEPDEETADAVDIEYVQESIDLSDPMYAPYLKIFEKFKIGETDVDEQEKNKENADGAASNPTDVRTKGINNDDFDSDDDMKKDDDKPKLSKKKLKLSTRLSVAQLKQKVTRPDLVEMHDVTAKDPEMLLLLKATRNSVSVPRHWCFKRKYLQGKRGIEKQAFDLPHFIKRTGIMDMRLAVAEKEDQKTLKAKMREKVRPKMGKIDIDYQKLHDAFFKWQTKPKMTIHGDLYYEGKEFETKMKDKKPGDLSDELRTALGMPVGPNSNKVPPPWLIAMQRYGPPPSYPNLKIPGLNAPIPDGCSFGYHAGGWGKPPVNDLGLPLYGTPFGLQSDEWQNSLAEEEIDKKLWGELESESSESSEEEEEDEEKDDEAEGEGEEADQSGLVTPADGGLTPSGITSIPAGMETPDMIELRKRKIEADMEEGGDTPALYTVLPEKKVDKVGGSMMGSTHTYDVASKFPSGIESSELIDLRKANNEADIDGGSDTPALYTILPEKKTEKSGNDTSSNKRKKSQHDSGKSAKRYKDFKF